MQELEKILYELEKCIFTAEVYNDDFDGTTITNLICLGDVRDILEKHMNDGWIPVEERLPDESLNSVIGWDEYRERCCFVQYYGGKWSLRADREPIKIIAWRPLPEPYRPERSEKND